MARVLVVDDEPSMRFLVGEGLRENGIDYDEAANGQEALKLLDQSLQGGPAYDGVVLDIMMPIVNGWEVLAAMKANPLLADIMVIVVTGAAVTQEDVARISGYDGVFMEKRGDFARLLNIILARLFGD
jgi:CheY-like chemotaxis protein